MLVINLYSNIASPASAFLSNITSLITNFQVKDMIDIFVIALLTYALLMLFIKTKSIPIIIGIFSMLLIYALAVFLKLSLTQMIFKYFLGMFLVVLIVIFQGELRRFFEMLGILGMRRKLFSYQEDAINIIARVARQCADSKIGALIVFPGKELIDRHIKGGVYLNGKISEQILLSIFDKYSPGHDGAVIIEGDKIKKFSVHLPLAEKMNLVKKFGTRHRSALGISEVTDALCVVVSEERGIISVTHNRKIETMPDMETLEKKLRNFFEKITPKKKVSVLKLVKSNAIPMLASLGIAVVFWGMFAMEDVNVQRNFVVPVEFRSLSADYVAEELSTQEIILTLAGDDRAFNLFDPKTLKVSLDASEMKLGWHKLLINKNFIKKPSDFSIVSIDPQSVTFKLSEIKQEAKETE